MDGPAVSVDGCPVSIALRLDSPLLPDCRAAIPRMYTAADALDTLVARIAPNIDRATVEHAAALTAIASALLPARDIVVSEQMRLLRHRSMWLQKQYDELSAVESILAAGAALCDWNDTDLETVVNSVKVLVPLSTCSPLPSLSSLLDVSRGCLRYARDSLRAFSRVGDGIVDPAASDLCGPGLQCCESGSTDAAREWNVIDFLCVDRCGDEVRGLQASDFTVSMILDGKSVIDIPLDQITLTGSCLSFVYMVNAPSGSTLMPAISVFGTPLTLPTAPIPVRQPLSL